MCLNETYSTFQVGKCASEMLPINNGFIQGDVLWPFLLHFALGYAIRRVQENQDGLKLNGAHQLLVYADDVNIWSRSVHTVRKDIEALVVVSKEIGLEVNADKTKYMVIYPDQNARQSHKIKTNSSYLNGRNMVQP